MVSARRRGKSYGRFVLAVYQGRSRRRHHARAWPRIGETMAVTFVIGNFNQLDTLSLFEAANSITSALANEFAEARPPRSIADLPRTDLVLHHVRRAFFIQAVVDADAPQRGTRT